MIGPMTRQTTIPISTTVTNGYVPQDERRRGVPLAPSSMSDSIADWPLHRVVAHLQKKEKEDRPTVTSLHCRSSIKSFVTIIEELASRYGASRNRMSSWLAYQGLMFARDDTVISRLISAQSAIRKVSLQADDVDTIDMMNSLIPYSPRIQESVDVQLTLYDWVSSEFEDLSRVCGVCKYQIVQVYQARSMLTDDAGEIAGVATRLSEEVARWDSWMGFRLAALERLVKDTTG